MRILILCVLLVLASTVSAAESYLCVADKSTGFKYNKQTKRWDYSRFNVRERRWIIRAPNLDEIKQLNSAPAFVVIGLGETFPESLCEKPFTDAGTLVCREIWDFKFSKDRLRYVAVYPMGYWMDSSEGSGDLFVEGKNDLAIEIGRCSPF
jgi:hypothetical protein